MFNFVEGYINRKALKQALKEVDEETLIASQAVSQNNEQRDYQTVDEADNFKSLKIKSAINKPLTSAVDLKNFKNWRDVNKVESNNPKYEAKKSFIFDDDDEGEEPQLDLPGLATKKEPIKEAIFDTVSSNKSEVDNSEKDTNISTFFKEKFGAISREPRLHKIPLKEVNPVSHEKPRVKTTLNELVAKMHSETNIQETKKEEKTQTLQSQKPTIKVEVVDFNQDKEKPKKVTNRKPRGKNKRRFDADVISNIDWK